MWPHACCLFLFRVCERKCQPLSGEIAEMSESEEDSDRNQITSLSFFLDVFSRTHSDTLSRFGSSHSRHPLLFLNMVTVVNSKADVLKATQALAVNLNAAKGLQEVMKTNLGPKGTLKMLVGGAGQIKITKDGNSLLSEMQIQHPTAMMIARASTAQDDITGDGTTSTVMFIGELMKQAESYLADGLHPRLIAEGFDLARNETVSFLDNFKVPAENVLDDRERMLCIARTSLRTKLSAKMADKMSEAVVDAIKIVKKPDVPVDLHMVEIMHMQHKLSNETTLVRGLVMDHGSRHPDMPKRLDNCYILTMNVSLEYEKSEVNAGFFYSSSSQRDQLADAERKFTDDKVRKICEFKREVCTEENKKTFVLINEKGIDPPSLEILAREGIIALRRAKRRNMERLPLAVGGVAGEFRGGFGRRRSRRSGCRLRTDARRREVHLHRGCEESSQLHDTPQGLSRPHHRSDEGCSTRWAAGCAEHACG